MFLTIVGGITFLGSQAWEWYHFIKGTEKALLIPSGEHGQKRVAHYVGVHDSHHDDMNRAKFRKY